jgi:hypothetical protein
MLLDRACPNGGWNAGNGVVYGEPLAPHVDATAIALLALCGTQSGPIVTASLKWIEERSRLCAAPSSIAWAALALRAHRQSVTSQIERLAVLAKAVQIQNYSTLAAVVLALKCADGQNIFEERS